MTRSSGRRWRLPRDRAAIRSSRPGEDAARDREELLVAVFDESPVAVLRVTRRGDLAHQIVDANAAAGRLLGLPPDRLVGAALHDFLVGRDRLVVGGDLTRTEVRVGRDGGQFRWVSATVKALSSSAGDDLALVVMQDVTERKQAEEQLNRAARHDALTGLINRDELLRRIADLGPPTSRHHVAVIFLDLDGFKVVNDTRGHHVGDELLVAVARRIRAAIRPGDFVGRIGGDEFVVVCPRLEDPRMAKPVAERVRATLDEPVSVEGREHRISMSLGIASARADLVNGPELLRQADMAMYRAKESGRNAIRYYSPAMDAELLAAERIREELRLALAGDGLVLHFQPVVELATGRLSYVEALVRLRDTDGALMYPGDFLPVAGRSGFMAQVGERVLRLALAQRAAWRQQGLDVPIGLNLAESDLFSTSFATEVLRTIHDSGDIASGVVLEMGEVGLLDATGPVQLTLRRLRAAGVGLAIDHFGTGQSSLGALRYLGVDRVKIDRSFVNSVVQSEGDRAIVQAAISVAHALGQRVVAEGVETPHQLELLANLGCDDAQGFLLCPAGPPDSLRLERGSWDVLSLLRQSV